MTLQNFFSMGGYAWYVWGAYFFVFIVLGLTSLSTYVTCRRIKNRMRKLHEN